MATVKNEPGSVAEICDKIIELCQDFSEGVGDKVLQNSMPDVDPKVRAKAINSLLQAGKIDLFKSESKGKDFLSFFVEKIVKFLLFLKVCFTS